MLGDLIGEGQGKRTARRVITVDPTFSVEVSFEGTNTILGVTAQEIGTYSSGPKPDGSLYGEGQGVVATPDGDIVTWKGAGTGKLAPTGAISYRGAVYFNSTSPKFARLNAVAGVFEFDVDPNGNTKSKIWEWK